MKTNTIRVIGFVLFVAMLLFLLYWFLAPKNTQEPPETEVVVQLSSTALPVKATDTMLPTAPVIPTTPVRKPTLKPSRTLSPEATVTATSMAETPQIDFVAVDHTSIDLFDQIPKSYLGIARELRMVFADRSVGDNINKGLDCLTAPSWGMSPPNCRRDYLDANWNWRLFNQSDYNAGQVSSRILFKPDAVKYNRNNWTYIFLEPGDWSTANQQFIEEIIPKYLDAKDVFSMQFTYLEVAEGSDIADLEKGFFADNDNRYDIYDLEAVMRQHPDKTFFFWTTSLARSIGTQESVDFNNQVREYARQHNIVLFDVADIESHDPQGHPCYDDRDGVPYCDQSGDCENNPDDGKDIPAICQDYTTEVGAGHLGSVSSGRIRLVKAFWVLMAMLAGWVP